MPILKKLSILLFMAVLMSCEKSNLENAIVTDPAKQVTVKIRSAIEFGLNADWQQTATELVQPRIDIYFSLNDGSNFHDSHSAKFNYPPIDREFTDKVSTHEIIGNEQYLVSYYRQIIEAARHYEIPFRDISHLFRIRLKIRDQTGSDKFSFAYYDTLSEINKFRNWIIQSDSTVLYADLDQGWGFEAQIKHPFVYMIEYIPESESDTRENYISYLYLENQLTLANNRAQHIIKILTERIGNDLWSKYRGYPWDDGKL